jgi:hypothetical protein
MAYIFDGHEEEGYYDILTGRPRFSVSEYNRIRGDRVKKRVGNFPKKRVGPAPFIMPEGRSHQVPGLLKIIKRVTKN